MDRLLLWAACNTLAALLLAFAVYALTRVWRHPQVAHLLWLLAVLRLVAPPVVQLEWPTGWPVVFEHHERLNATPEADRAAHLATRTGTRAEPAVPIRPLSEDGATANWRAAWPPVRVVLVSVWLGGVAVCGLVVARRVVRFGSRVRAMLPAPEYVQQLAHRVAGRLGVRRVPEVRAAESVDVPFVWWAGRRAAIVVPSRLPAEVDADQLALILAHELAHLRRRDHWVRVVELIVSVLYWWNPLVAVARRQLHAAEDACCDAWVRATFPQDTKRYAEVLLWAAESLGGGHTKPRLLPASPFLGSLSLKARIAMILESRFAPRASKKSLVGVAVLAVVVLPSFLLTANPNAAVGAGEKAAAGPSEFPFVVPFEQGATKFLEGDDITILEVRGTAETFEPGHLYWIRGTYKLASHPKAGLSAYTTAAEAKDARSTPLRVQSVGVEQGEGTFTLFLPMLCRGWPHVSFYPQVRGSSFGGNYFGTGDSVLERWWGEEE